MLYRSIGEKRVCITQPHHAWIAGQLARSWGNDRFGSIEPYEAVCLGAEQHDIGWVTWENAPTLNPETGYPRAFTEVPPEVHTRLWANAKHLAMPMGRYATLLVSLHGTGLYERFTHWKRSPDSTRVVEAFLQEEREFQRQFIDRLKEDPAYSPHVTPEAIARNRQLVATVDALSLAICIGVTSEKTIDRVPTATGETRLTLRAIDGDPNSLSIDPWCFRDEGVNVAIEGRILQEKADNESEMRQKLDNAPWINLAVALRPA
jgi:hypothetical protein